jgi:hypothetical protein
MKAIEYCGCFQKVADGQQDTVDLVGTADRIVSLEPRRVHFMGVSRNTHATWQINGEAGDA